MNFKLLVNGIQQAHDALQSSAVKAVNRHITIRNWLIGYYIVEFEQNGDDRAKYGDKLLALLAKEFAKKNLNNINERELRRFRLFYNTYPSMSSLFFQEQLTKSIRGTLSPELILHTL